METNLKLKTSVPIVLDSLQSTQGTHSGRFFLFAMNRDSPDGSAGSESSDGPVRIEPTVWTLDGKLKKLTEDVTDPTREAILEYRIPCSPQAGWTYLIEFATQYALMNEIEPFDAHSLMTAKPTFRDYDKFKPNRKTTFEVRTIVELPPVCLDETTGF